MTEFEPPKLVIEIDLDDDDPIGLDSFLTELPWFGVVGGSKNLEATVIQTDGTERDMMKELYD